MKFVSIPDDKLKAMEKCIQTLRQIRTHHETGDVEKFKEELNNARHDLVDYDSVK